MPAGRYDRYDLYLKYGVKRGLRDLNGQGVLTGLTNISNVVAFNQKDGQRVPCDGQLWYCADTT